MTAIFRQNLQLFARENPVPAFQLQEINAKGYRFSTKGEINLTTPFGKVYEEGKIASWRKSLYLESVRVVYLFGIGLGAEYEALLGWLKEDPLRRIVFFEEDPFLLKKFLSLESASVILEDPQVSIMPYWQDQRAAALERVFWSNVLTPYLVAAIPFYQRIKEAAYKEFKHQIEYDFSNKDALVDEYLKFGVPFFKNFYPNLAYLPGSYFGNRLFGQFKGVPAIICGAGPSLEKQLKTLSGLKEKALIFGGGSSLNALTAQGITPHFGAGIDPNSMQQKRLEATSGFKVPFFYRTRIFHEALKCVKGERLYISGTGGYDISEWYEEALGLKDEFIDEGHNIVNFCTEIAYRMGCNPILYVGVDLAYTDKRAYASGVDAKSESVVEEGALTQPDIEGKPVLTLWKWVAESKWFSEFQMTHPDIQLINCTEGGIGFAGIPNVSFKEAIAAHLQKEWALKGQIENAVEKASLPAVTEERVKELTKEFHESLLRSIAHLDILLTAPFTQEGKMGGRAILAEEELQQEIAYRYLLHVFLEVYSRIQNHKILKIKNMNLTPEELNIEKWNLQKQRLQFLRDVAEANRLLIEFNP